jgi:hypothetical protein
MTIKSSATDLNFPVAVDGNVIERSLDSTLLAIALIGSMKIDPNLIGFIQPLIQIFTNIKKLLTVLAINAMANRRIKRLCAIAPNRWVAGYISAEISVMVTLGSRRALPQQGNCGQRNKSCYLNRQRLIKFPPAERRSVSPK